MAENIKYTKDEIREAAEADLLTFIRLVAPHRVLGAIHEEVISWWTREEAKSHQLLLLPRGHQKSELIALRVAWAITRNPAITILYISSTSGLAEEQLGLIKTILTSPVYRRYWPEMVHEQEGKRELWNNSAIKVDHPLRKKEQVRDPTVFTAGLGTSVTGLHCDIAVLDDVVAPENAYTEDGRNKVTKQYSLLSSIENPGAEEWVVGTRYHPRDLYQDMKEMVEEIYDDSGDIIETDSIYEVFQRVVETDGEFLWPRTQGVDGRWFGFNAKILAKIYGKYLDKTQFYAQYYNNPNSSENAEIDRSSFQYYDRKFIKQEGGYWYFKERRLNVYAAIDFAFSRSKKADYTAIVVIGIDHQGNIYVLDIDRFKTGKVSEYFQHLLDLYVKWGFRKLRAEVSVAQQVIVSELKDQYFKPNGLSIKIDEHRPSRHEGDKRERMSAILEPRYSNLAVWHYKGGLCQELEDELVMSNPPHDDIKDALSSAIEISVPPRDIRERDTNITNIAYHPRFGGVV